MLAMANQLPPITERQRAYAFAHCFAPLAIYWRRKRQVRCMCCGYTMVWDKPFLESFIDVGEYDCPNCNKTMAVQDHSETDRLVRMLFVILTTFRGVQVARAFEVYRDNTQPDVTHYGIDEAFQTWLLPDGKEVITGHPLQRSVFSMAWQFHKPMDIRHHNASTTGAYATDDIYDLAGYEFYPDVRVTPLLRRNGWTRELLRYRAGISMIDAMRWLLTVPTAEMFVKTGQLDLFYNMVRRQQREFPLLHCVRIANRRGYIVHDAQMWLDMLDMAQAIGLDTHNPDVLCPPDLREAHDRIRARHTKMERKRQRQLAREKAAEREGAYSRDKGRYFGICFGNDNVVISVITSVADMLAEGEAMHHCVYGAGYYRKKDSLILSARDKDGKRLETIEVNLRTFQVEQSRAVCNSTSPRHHEILDLMQKNMHLIRAAAVS